MGVLSYELRLRGDCSAGSGNGPAQACRRLGPNTSDHLCVEL